MDAELDTETKYRGKAELDPKTSRPKAFGFYLEPKCGNALTFMACVLYLPYSSLTPY